LAGTFKGAASTAANTASGQMKSLSIQMGQFKESIGAAILPLVEKMLPALQAFSKWAQENPQLVTILAAAMGVLAASIVAVNVAMALNPYVAVAAAVIALAAGLAYLWVKFDDLRPLILGLVTGPFGLLIAGFVYLKNVSGDVVNFIVDKFGSIVGAVQTLRLQIMDTFSLIYSGIKATMGFIADVITAPFKTAFRAVAWLWNNTVGAFSFTIPSWVPLGLGGKSFDVPDIPMLAEGGIVNSATLAVIGESGPEAVIPLSKMGQFGMGSGSNITVNVNGGDPNSIVRALQQYVRNSGPLPVSIQ
jgi:phage-related protein